MRARLSAFHISQQLMPNAIELTTVPATGQSTSGKTVLSIVKSQQRQRRPIAGSKSAGWVRSMLVPNSNRMAPMSVNGVSPVTTTEGANASFRAKAPEQTVAAKPAHSGRFMHSPNSIAMAATPVIGVNLVSDTEREDVGRHVREGGKLGREDLNRVQGVVISE
jgi:hypothetical protein